MTDTAGLRALAEKYETVAMHGSMTEIEEARGEYKRAVANPQTIIALIDRAEKAERGLAEAKAQARTPDQEMLDFANDVLGAYPPGSPEYRLAEFVWVTRPSPSPGQNT